MGYVPSVHTLASQKCTVALKLTTAKYYTPGGYVIHENGIEPDVIVELSPKEEESLYIQRSRLKTMPLEEFVERYAFEPIEDKQLEMAKQLLWEELGETRS